MTEEAEEDVTEEAEEDVTEEAEEDHLVTGQSHCGEPLTSAASQSGQPQGIGPACSSRGSRFAVGC